MLYLIYFNDKVLKILILIRIGIVERCLDNTEETGVTIVQIVLEIHPLSIFRVIYLRVITLHMSDVT